MEFICSFSVKGTLVTYFITKEGETYNAVLKENGNQRNDLPKLIKLQKHNTGWQAEPWNEEIINGLTYAIESEPDSYPKIKIE